MRSLADEAYARRYPPTPSGRSIAGSSYRTFGISGSGGGAGLSEEQFRILGEFQRVVYGNSGGRSLMVDDDDEVEQGKDGADDVDPAERKEQLRMFLEQHFEANCVYESPLITLHSRPLIIDALTLSTNLAASRLPSIYPRALLTHSGNIARWGIRKLFGWQETPSSSPAGGGMGKVKGKDVESALSGSMEGEMEHYAAGRVEQIARASVPWLPLFSSGAAFEDSKDEKGNAEDAWWEVWHVTSECQELGGFETWHGCHTGIIDHTITLKLLPSLLGTATEPSQTPSPDDGYPFLPTSAQYPDPNAAGFSTLTSPAPSTSYLPSHYTINAQQHPLLRLRTRTRPVPVPSHQNSSTLLPIAAIQKALATMLTFQLRVKTFVEFNEQGRVVYVRDLVDVRDVWEAVVPFGREAGWVGRRVCGVLLAGLGRVFGTTSSDEARPSWARERELQQERARKGKEKAGVGLYSHNLALQDAAAVPETTVPEPAPGPAAAVEQEPSTIVDPLPPPPTLPLKTQDSPPPPSGPSQQLPTLQPQPHALSNMLGLQEAWSPLRPTFHPTSAALVQMPSHMQRQRQRPRTTTTPTLTAPDVDHGGGETTTDR
ncbi:hypothetical protein QFC22_006428 [Naganishia vaughanmartiniae]|uniref:Uncharacterized protein n=1 Tax=Naganishia vaughanmartiniae TaxID=1424756 RepID=A0ACC2WKM2_9TREE|nr:hypothetical protein QFC22_006428 [Naganishia vaughanmartiniae]